MKLRHKLCLTLLFLAVMIALQAFIWPSASMAQQGGPVTLITDDNGIDGFDRYQNTLY